MFKSHLRACRCSRRCRSCSGCQQRRHHSRAEVFGLARLAPRVRQPIRGPTCQGERLCHAQLPLTSSLYAHRLVSLLQRV